MYKLVVLAILAVCAYGANIDATGFGIPEDTHKTGFGAAIPLSSGLADEDQQQLQLVDEAPLSEEAASANHVKEMFSNAFNGIRAQREKAAQQDAATQTA